MNEQNLARQMMICGHIKPNNINDDYILDALNAVPREIFIPKSKRSVAYIDSSIDVGGGRFAMDTLTLSRLIHAAEVDSSDLVLVVGGASGYEAAVLCQCAEAVVCLEQDAKLVARSTSDLLTFGADNVAVVEGELSQGVKGQGPFDVIFINGAVEHIPDELISQLADGGRLVCIMLADGVAHGHVVEKMGAEVISYNVFETEAAVLPGFGVEKGFVFP